MSKLNLKSGDIILIKAKPNSSKSIIEYDFDKKIYKGFVHSIPDNNKANNEIVKNFKKQFKLKVEIISGFKSKNKKIKIL